MVSNFVLIARSLIICTISVDIDECFFGPCHINASCNDTDGGFACQCDSGYSGNGFNCSSM